MQKVNSYLTIIFFFLLFFTSTNLIAFAANNQQGVDWYSMDWKYRIMLEINPEKIDSPLSSFPVYVNLNSLGAEMFDKINLNCSDIRITASNGVTLLPREIMNCDKASHTGLLVFSADYLSTTSTTKFYIYFDNKDANEPVATSNYGKNAVWKSEFKGVWHLNETGGNRNDSTSNNNTLTDNSGISSVEGKLGLAANINSAHSDYLSIPDIDQKNLDMSPKISVSAWIKPRSTGIQAIVSKYGIPSGQAWLTSITLDPSNSYLSFFYSASGNTTVATPGIQLPQPFATSTWLNVVWEIDATTQIATYYINGELVGSAKDNQGLTSIYDTTAPFIIGNRSDGGWQFDGLIQEVKVSEGNLSSSWIKAEYVNQNNPNNFYTFSNIRECRHRNK